jgi:tetratricopeptide (TPR) repeat protein
MPTPNTPTLWKIPYQRNPFFTGQEDILNQLYQTLHAANTVALSHPQGITGLGGIGKTQMALEYAYRYGAEYSAVLWIRADSSAGLVSSFVELAHVLELPERNEQDQNIIVEAVQRWFRLHTGWLLIFDNMNDLLVAEPFLPKAGPGHLLFTTRAHALDGIAQRLEVQQMEPDTGALLLLRRASILPLQAVLDMATRDDRSVASVISQELAGLPLALDQAGAYIDQYIKEASCETLSGLQEYLKRYQTRRQELELLNTRGHADENAPAKDYPASVATTWSLSFEKVSQVNPAAAELLNFCALLAPDAIPEEILSYGASHLGAVLAPVATNSMQLDQVCKEVLRFSLVQRNPDAKTLTMHRLVQAVLQDALPPSEREVWAERAMLAVNAAFPDVAFESWSACERLLPHALTCATWIGQAPNSSPEAPRLLNHAGYYLDERARYEEAEPLLKRALTIHEQQLGATHPHTAASLSMLARLYLHQGKYGEAEPLWQRALAISEQQLGAQHPDTALSLNNLAELYVSQGKYAKAEPLLKRALTIYEQQLGYGHPTTQTIQANYFGLLEAMKSEGEADS